MIERIRTIYDYRDMIYSLVRRELRGRYPEICIGYVVDVFKSIFPNCDLYNCVYFDFSK